MLELTKEIANLITALLNFLTAYAVYKSANKGDK